jgi:hypothetical protein
MSKRSIPGVLVSPASRTPETAIARIDHAAKPITRFEQLLGGRAAIADALSVDPNPTIRELLTVLLDPHFDGYSLGDLSTRAGIGLLDLLRAYRNNRLVKAQILAMNIISERLPAVVADVMQRATPHTAECSLCEGTGTVTPSPTVKHPDPVPVTCGVCKGAKVRPVLPDLERQRLALELGELTRVPKGGTVLNQQFNLGSGLQSAAASMTPGSLEQMQQAVTSILYSRRAITLPSEAEADATIEATPVEPPS